MCGDWSGFAAEKDKNVSTKVGLFEAKKITGEVAKRAAHALPAGSLNTEAYRIFRYVSLDSFLPVKLFESF